MLIRGINKITHKPNDSDELRFSRLQANPGALHRAMMRMKSRFEDNKTDQLYGRGRAINQKRQ